MDDMLLILTQTPNYIGFVVAIYILIGINRRLNNRIDELEAKLDYYWGEDHLPEDDHPDTE